MQLWMGFKIVIYILALIRQCDQRKSFLCFEKIVIVLFIQTFNQNVTGPSLVRLTCISAANCPLATVTFSAHFCEK